MEITGKIYAALPEREGESANGKWRMASYVLQTEGAYPYYFAFDVADGSEGRIQRLNIKEGKRMTVYFDIRAHEYQGKWYNQVRAYDAREVASEG